MASVVVMEMNGDKVSKTLSYIPVGRPYYNVVSKGDKQVRCSTAEEVLDFLTTNKEAEKVFYVKVPSSFHAMDISALRIA